MAVDKPKIDVDAYLSEALTATPPELHPFFHSFKDLHNRKLWHQITLKLFEFFDHPQSKPYRVDVYDKFVRDFEGKLNQLKLVEMGVKVSKEIDNPKHLLTFFTDLLARIPTETARDAHVLLLATLSRAKLVYGDEDGAKKDMEEAWKSKSEFAPYYRNSLLYLACIELSDLEPEEQLSRAHDLGLSAFLGDTIYNFGELLMHPILDALNGTPHEWIKKLLFTFNEGNIGKFEALAPLFPREPLLQEHYPFLRQKICLMALIESVFKRNAYDRTMSFQTIAEETRLPPDEVEHLVMKALSLKLIKGSLDQVDQKAYITWVQPRVLSLEQIGQLSQRLSVWGEKLHKVEDRIAPEVLVSP
ncbi:26S proteasome regulatory subunit [Steccherinum ochraceum]|uniref:26S proteasome regulatory subunit n=1 Tax=Steccherinum ochraceum TaxID=92696 RepID=A0A4R0R5E8_9APHY|nr:26S proteasome regulatory subunit [Steccherinum ochraceum]